MDKSEKGRFSYDTLEIIENLLHLLGSKELEIRELYAKLEKMKDASIPGMQSGLELRLNSASGRYNHKTLIADPNLAVRMKLKQILSTDADCFVISEARSGKELVKNHKQFKPSLIVSELDLPSTAEGYEALMKVKETDPKVNVIIIGSHVDDVTLLRAMEIGAFDFLLKPVNHIRLVETVKRLNKPTKEAASVTGG